MFCKIFYSITAPLAVFKHGTGTKERQSYMKEDIHTSTVCTQKIIMKSINKTTTRRDFPLLLYFSNTQGNFLIFRRYFCLFNIY